MEVTIKKYGRTWTAYTYGPPWFHIEGKTKREVAKKTKAAIQFYCQHLLRQIPTIKD